MGKASRRKRERREAEAKWGTRVVPTETGRRIEFDAMSPAAREIAEGLEDQRKRFREKFGRDPGPNDPIFFDPDADEPRPMRAEVIETETVAALQAAGFDNAYIYAYQQTGLMPNEMNLHLLAENDIAEFEDAVDRYRSMHDDGQPVD